MMLALLRSYRFDHGLGVYSVCTLWRYLDAHPDVDYDMIGDDVIIRRGSVFIAHGYHYF